MADTNRVIDRIEYIFDQMDLAHTGAEKLIRRLDIYIKDFNTVTDDDPDDIRQAMTDGLRETANEVERNIRNLYYVIYNAMPKGSNISPVNNVFLDIIQILSTFRQASSYYEMIHIADPHEIPALYNELDELWDACKAAWRAYTNPIAVIVQKIDQFSEEQGL